MMKKIFISLGLASAALGFTACEETWDKNPRLDGHTGTIQADFLNEPELGNTAIMLTSQNATGNFHLTASQPYFGYAASCTYRVQVSYDPTFAEGNYREITKQDFYNAAEINPVNKDVAAALEYLLDVKSEEDLPTPTDVPVYMRLRAFIAQSPDNSEYVSNIVKFNGIAANYLAIWVAGQPANYYLRGGFNDWGAEEGSPYQFITASKEETNAEEDSWISGEITIQDGTQFKVADNAWKNINMGSPEGEMLSIQANKEFSLTQSSNSGNIVYQGETFTGRAMLFLKKTGYQLYLIPNGSEPPKEEE